MIEVVPYRPYHLELLSAQGIQDRQKLSYVPVAHASVQRPPGPALTVFEGERVILCGGILTVGRIGTLWALLSHRAGPHMLFLHRATLRLMDTVSCPRLEATAEKGFIAATRWLTLLGFEHEGDMRGYGENGETHERWARIR